MSAVHDSPARAGAPAPPPGPMPTPEPGDAVPPAFAAFCAELADVLARPAERKRNLCRLAAALDTLADASVALLVPAPGGILLCEVGTGELAQLEGDVAPVDGTLEGDAYATGEAGHSDNLRVDARAYLPQQRDLPNTPAVVLPIALAWERLGVALFAARRRDQSFPPGRVEALQQALGLMAGAMRNFGVHERVRASRSVLDAMRAARPREAEGVRKMLRAVRHELNTPVSAILGNLQLCASADPGDWQMSAAEFRQAIATGSARLEGLSRLLHALEESHTPVELDFEGRIVPPAAWQRRRGEVDDDEDDED